MEFCVRIRQSVQFEWNSALEGNKDHLPSQARSDLAKKEFHVESRNKCTGDLQKRTEAQNKALQDVQNEFVENKLDCKRNCYERKNIFEIRRFENEESASTKS